MATRLSSDLSDILPVSLVLFETQGEWAAMKQVVEQEFVPKQKPYFDQVAEILERLGVVQGAVQAHYNGLGLLRLEYPHAAPYAIEIFTLPGREFVRVREVPR